MLSFVIRNTFLTLTAALALAVAGFWSWRHLPVDAIPDLSDNQVIVWAEWPGKSPQDMDQQVTSRLARELQGLPGVQTVRGMSLYGASLNNNAAAFPAHSALGMFEQPAIAESANQSAEREPSSLFY